MLLELDHHGSQQPLELDHHESQQPLELDHHGNQQPHGREEILENQ